MGPTRMGGIAGSCMSHLSDLNILLFVKKRVPFLAIPKRVFAARKSSPRLVYVACDAQPEPRQGQGAREEKLGASIVIHSTHAHHLPSGFPYQGFDVVSD